MSIMYYTIRVLVALIVLVHLYPLVCVLFFRCPELLHCLKKKRSAQVILVLLIAFMTDVFLRHFLFYSLLPSAPIRDGFHRTKMLECVLACFLALLLKRMVDPRYPRSRRGVAASGGFSMRGKTVVITGGNSGIGMECAISLACMGADLIIGCRNEAKARAAVASVQRHIAAAKSPGSCRSAALDLASFASVVSFVESVTEGRQGVPIQALVNNAGFAPDKSFLTADGYEVGIQAMHLGHQLLTRLLLPHMAKDARIVTVASFGHTMATGDMLTRSMLHDTSLGTMSLYGRAKLANVLFTRELQRRLSAREQYKRMRAFTLHPGCVYTNIWVWPIPSALERVVPHLPYVFRFCSFLLMRTSEEGSADMTFAVASEEVESLPPAAYLISCIPAEPSTDASNEELQHRLWEDTEEAYSSFLQKRSIKLERM